MRLNIQWTSKFALFCGFICLLCAEIGGFLKNSQWAWKELMTVRVCAQLQHLSNDSSLSPFIVTSEKLYI